MAGRLKTTVQIGSKPAITHFETLKGSGAKDTFSGRTSNPIYARAAASRINTEIAHLMVSNLLENEVSRGSGMDQRVMANAMLKAGQAEAARLVTFIHRWLLGIEGNTEGVRALTANNMAAGMRGAGGARPKPGTIEWKGLGHTYLRKKGDKRYFRNTGKLAHSILAMQKYYPAALGGIRVERQDFSKSRPKALANIMLEGVARRSVILGTIDVKIFPTADRGLFPGLQTGNWAQTDARARLERSGFFPDDVSKKLRGPIGKGSSAYPFRFRPMFGPVTQFWMLHRIPSAMAAALRTSSKARS